jgi:iron complex outermembrane receptor protein
MGPHTATRAIVVAMFVVLVVGARDARAQSAAPLGGLSLEQLMHVRVEPVFGASRRVQPVTEAPASITIVTADQIARYGYRTLADVLASVRGLYVTSDRNYDYLGVRGFSRPGDYDTRVLLLVNGHRMNDNVYDQASIGGDFGLDPSVFDRVEIIRGPASALYGTSAFLAVVNVITKKAGGFEGASVEAGGGTFGTLATRTVAGRRVSRDFGYLVSVAAGRTAGQRRLYFPAFDAPATNNGVAERADAESVQQSFAQIAFKHLTVTGAFGRRPKHVPTAAFDARFNDARYVTTDTRSYLDAEFDLATAAGRATVRVSLDHYIYRGLVPYDGLSPGAPSYLQHDDGVGTWWGVDARLTRALGARHTLTGGGEVRFNPLQRQMLTDADPTVSFDIRGQSTVGAVYAQDELRLTRSLLVDGGARLDAYAGYQRISPRIGLIVRLSDNESIKLLYGRAFRAPNAYERLFYPANRASNNLRPEDVATSEIAWERYTGTRLRTSVSGYVNRIDHLVTLVDVPGGTGALDDLEYRNANRVDARGVETEAEVRLQSGLEWLASYAWQDTRDAATNAPVTNSPRHLAKFRMSAPIPRTSVTPAVEVQALSSRSTPAGTTVRRVATVNFIATARIQGGLDLTATVRNLFGVRYADPASAEHVPDAIPQDGRTVFVGLRWSFKRP